MHQHQNSTQLRWAEWAITGAVFLFIITLVLIAKIQAHRFSAGTFVLPPPVEITIEGQVKKPGVYPTSPGTLIIDVIKKAKPLRFADLHGIDLESRVQGPLTLNVPKLEYITVVVQGSALQVPAGTRLCDLKKFLPEAAPLKNRRLLSDGETITIP